MNATNYAEDGMDIQDHVAMLASTFKLESYVNPASPAWDNDWDGVQEALAELQRRDSCLDDDDDDDDTELYSDMLWLVSSTTVSD